MEMSTKLLVVMRPEFRFLGWALGILVAIPCLSYGQWEPLAPTGGGIQVLTGVNSDPATLIAGTRNAFLYRSRDKAGTWHPIPFPRSFHAALNTLILDPCNPSTMLVGVSDGPGLPGLYKTTNN